MNCKLHLSRLVIHQDKSIVNFWHAIFCTKICNYPLFYVFSQLFIIFLSLFSLEARLLWKRIPSDIKNENVELQKVWNIGKQFFTRDLFSIQPSIDREEWPDYLVEMMEHLRDETVERVINLISAVYSCIHINDIVSALHLSLNESIEKVNSLGWRYTPQDGFVYPVKLEKDNNVEQDFDQSLANLTKYVAFLESN